LVYCALASIKTDLRNSKPFYKNQGSKFKNKLIDDALAKATFKIIKTEFIKSRHFDSFEG